MLRRLIESAFQTGYLSVESEGLIRQVLEIRGYQAIDLSALEELQHAVELGQVKREARGKGSVFSLRK